jgi:hypothetical protein
MSRAGFPTSTKMLPDACARVGGGLPLPRTVTRISPSLIGSAPGTYTSAYGSTGCPMMGVVATAFVPPKYARSVYAVDKT